MLADLLRPTLTTDPERTALRWGNESWTYAQVEETASRLASALLLQGLQPTDRVALLLPNRPELVFAYLACFKAGFIAVPLNYRYQPPQINYALRQSGSTALLVHSERLDDLDRCPQRANLSRIVVVAGPAPAGTLPFAALLEPTASPEPLPQPSGEELAYILYTSGTTRRPRGVTHSHSGVTQGLRCWLETVPFGSSDVSLVSLSIAHTLGLTTQVLAMLHAGGCVVLLERYSPDLLWQTYRQSPPVTFLALLPAPLAEALAHPLARECDFRSLRLCICGGDRVPLALHRDFQALTGLELTEMCGMTEAGHYAVNPPLGRKKPGSVGLPMTGVQLRLVDKAGQDVPAGATGEILVCSPSMMVGYWNDTLESHRLLRRDWLKTGDLGRFDEDGYLWFMGRSKDILIRDGSNISPREVEDVLLQHPAVGEAGVVGVSDPVHGQAVHAFVQLRRATPQANEEELISFTRERLPRYACPERIEIVADLPRNATGKLDRERLHWLAEASGTHV